MSQADNPQRRTTYLISLTLVKVEALPEDVAGKQVEKEGEGSPKESEEVRHAPKEEEVRVGPQASDKESTQAGEEVEQVHVKYGSPNEKWIKAERRDQKDVPIAKSKDAAPVHPSLRQMVKVYSGGSFETTVRREGPRSDASRPKTELYREPPRLFPKGENGAELNNRSRCSLPFSVPPQVSQRPEVLMRPHTGANAACWKEAREANNSLYHSAKTLERRDNRIGDQSPLMAATTLGPYRASWADSDGRGTLIRPAAPLSGGYSGIMNRENSHEDRFKVSLVTPVTCDVNRPPRKTTSRTLDNSDLHCLSEDARRGKEGQGGTIHRAPVRDRKMLKFISGIFSKSAAVPPNVSTASALYPAADRGSSEEEGKFFIDSSRRT